MGSVAWLPMQSSERDPASDLILAVDVGGTKMAVGLVKRTGAILWSTQTATPTGGEAEQIWSALEQLLSSALAQGRPVACGAGCGGPMERGGEAVSPLNIPGMAGLSAAAPPG